MAAYENGLTAGNSQPVETHSTHTLDSIGTYPKRRNTLVAGILASLLDARRMTGLGAVRGASTTRLAAHIHVLRTKYSWPIESKDLIVATADGRIETVSEYGLSDAVLQRAFDAGSDDFCESVRVARAKLRGAHHGK